MKVAEPEVKTSGGIILPDSVQKRPTAGEVVAVGDGNTAVGPAVTMKLTPGQTVLYSRFGIGAQDVTWESQPYVLIREDDCIGIMPKPGVHASDIPDMKPIGDRVLVAVQEEEGVTVGGVLLPDAAKEKPVMGVVHAVGDGKGEEEMDVAVGDKIVYFKYAGDPMETPDGRKWTVLRQNDILCKTRK